VVLVVDHGEYPSATNIYHTRVWNESEHEFFSRQKKTKKLIPIANQYKNTSRTQDCDESTDFPSCESKDFDINQLKAIATNSNSINTAKQVSRKRTPTQQVR
jgi:hypothetical protein